MQDFNKECAASSDKGSEPVVLCSKMVRIAAAFLKETDPEGYEMLCEGLAKANPDSIAFINEHQPGMSFYGEMPDMYSLVLNSDHKLVKQVLEDAESACAEQLWL